MEGTAVGLYVIQVSGGRETSAADMIKRVARNACSDCFVPRYEVMRKKQGVWSCVQQRLFPGYVFVETTKPDELAHRLRSTPLFTRLLSSAGNVFVPLTSEEVTWLKAHVDVETHVMGMSQGVIEGDRVVVTSGPMRGQEANITKIDRHKRLAWMDMDIFGRTKSIRVGLEIVDRR